MSAVKETLWASVVGVLIGIVVPLLLNSMPYNLGHNASYSNPQREYVKGYISDEYVELEIMNE